MYTTFHGEKHNGEYVDETLRKYFPDYNYKGVFIDVGAFEPIRISNSHHFYKNGWDVYSFEANPDLIPLLKTERKHVYNYALSNVDKDSVEFTVVNSSGSEEWTAGYSALEISNDYKNIFGWNPKSIKTIHVQQKTLNNIFENELLHVKNIDILSMDIEGGELNCLHGLDLNVHAPRVMVIENVTHDSKITEYLKNFGYVLDKVIAYNEFYIKN